jgi:hypothetical protein
MAGKITAAEVLRQHAALTDRWREPSQTLLNYTRSFASDVASKRGAKAVGIMFAPMETTRIVEPWVRIVGRDLFTARTFQVTDEMCRVTTDLYQKTTAKIRRLSAAELPAESGFAWLDEPPSLMDRKAKVTRPRAMSWSTCEFPSTSGDGRGLAIRLVFWADTHVEDGFTGDWEPGVLELSERQLGRLQLQHPMIVPLDYDLEVESRFTRVFDGTSPLADNAVAWFHALLMLMGTELAARQRGFVPRDVTGDVKKRLKRSEVSVVTLRRAALPREEVSAAAREYRYCWLVQGHHRHLEAYEIPQHHAIPAADDRAHCVTCGSRITWVRPHVKGPDGAPVKPASTVYRLSR